MYPTIGISFVLLAYNEAASIALAIADCRSFARDHLSSYEIIVVDDGSSDSTGACAEAASEGDVRVIRHPRNLGMGASMRDGYLAAREDYLAHLPGDRQVRAQALEEMLAHCSRETVVLTRFRNPPSGQARVVMSRVFRLLTRHVGDLRVDFAGTYLFHRDWLTRVDIAQARSNSFLFSFQLLELMRRADARFASVPIPTFLREDGQSREATAARIVKMLIEIAGARLWR